MHVAERQDYHLTDDVWFSYKILTDFLLEVFLSVSFRHRSQSGPDFSEMNNDADLTFIAA